MDRDRLVKLLGMTASAHDGEALNALRMVQKMMEAEKVTWDELIAVPKSNVKIVINLEDWASGIRRR